MEEKKIYIQHHLKRIRCLFIRFSFATKLEMKAAILSSRNENEEKRKIKGEEKCWWFHM
jgi:hypothetical protein